MELNLSLQQRQTLSLKQTISVHILQLNNLQLTDYIQKESMENPVIEFTMPTEYITSSNYTYRYKNTEDCNPLEEINGEMDSQSLWDHLLTQIKLTCLPLHQQAILAAVSGFIESTGYITASSQEIATACHLTVSEVDNAIAYLQTLEPAGIAARSLSECLLLQMDKEDTLSCQIITAHLPLVAKNKLKQLAQLLDCPLSQVQQSVSRIRQLSPRPGLLFERQLKPPMVLPDFILKIENQVPYVQLLNEKSLGFSLSNYYCNLLKDCQDPKTIAYLTQKIESARWLQQCIENRNKTLLRIAQAIVAHQVDIFLSPKASLAPLKQEDIAQELDIHISTVSRGIKDKHLQYGGKVISLKSLFCVGTCAANGLQMSTDAVKQRIKTLIETEDENAPLSDQKISDILKTENISCSRRTVAKYRESMGIASTNLR